MDFPGTIPELVAWRGARSPERNWLRFESDTWTLSDALAEIERAATGLAERGVQRGDRVALLLGNRPEAIFCWLGVETLGAIAALLNPAFKPAELAGLFDLIRPRAVVAGEHRALAEAAGAKFAAPPALVAPDALARAGRGAPRAAVAPDDIAVLLATSGTTGAPKAVAQTHRTYALTAEAFPSWLGLDASDRLMLALPLFHINAQAYGVVAALGAGAGLALVSKFSASRFWQDARRLGATEVNVVGAMLRILLGTQPGPADRDHGVRVVYGALALPEAEHRAFEARFGVELTVGYGMSETTFGTIWPRGAPPRYGTMGRLRQHPRLGEVNRARVVREDGSEAPPDEAGELWLDNPAVMHGYYAAPDATRAALAGGWLHTGDVVRRDADGTFTFVARKKEMIRRRGENISAAEVENALLTHPDVREAAVLGVPSELGEDELVAYVAPEPGRVLDTAELAAFVRERLADFKVPSVIHVCDALPHTATERVAKHLLR